MSIVTAVGTAAPRALFSYHFISFYSELNLQKKAVNICVLVWFSLLLHILTMKCLIPEIFWHNRDPVLSVDIQPKPLNGDDKIRLASGGYDSHVLVSH